MCMSSSVVCTKCRRFSTTLISWQTFTLPPSALVIYILSLSTSDHGFDFNKCEDFSENFCCAWPNSIEFFCDCFYSNRMFKVFVSVEYISYIYSLEHRHLQDIFDLFSILLAFLIYLLHAKVTLNTHGCFASKQTEYKRRHFHFILIQRFLGIKKTETRGK